MLWWYSDFHWKKSCYIGPGKRLFFFFLCEVASFTCNQAAWIFNSHTKHPGLHVIVVPVHMSMINRASVWTLLMFVLYGIQSTRLKELEME